MVQQLLAQGGFNDSKNQSGFVGENALQLTFFAV